jgi:hypothetical protein
LKHADVQKRMADYLEGDLALERRAVFDAHLDSCTECRAEVEELRAIPKLLRTLPDEEPPPMLAADVMRRIRLGEATPTPGDRIRAFLSELASPGIAIPTGAMLAAFVLAATSGRFGLPMSAPRVAELSSANRLAPIPPEATELARRVFGVETDGISRTGVLGETHGSQLARRGGAVPTVRPPTYIVVQPASTGGSGADARQRVRIVTQRSALAPRFADSGQGSPSSVDDWLVVVQQQPAEFARRQASLSLAEREHWVRVLARRAAETNAAEAVMEALEQRGGPEAVTFARAFAAEARLPSSQLATPR